MVHRLNDVNPMTATIAERNRGERGAPAEDEEVARAGVAAIGGSISMN
jgi:hypothetical protein